MSTAEGSYMIKDEHIRLFKFIDRNGKGILGVVSWLSIELVFFFFLGTYL